MTRQTHILVPFVLSAAIVNAVPAGAQPPSARAAEAARTAAAASEAQRPAFALPTVQIDEQAIEEMVRKAEAIARDRMALASVASNAISADLAADIAEEARQAAQSGSSWRVVNLNKDEASIYYDRGTRHLDAGRWQAAIEAFGQAIGAGGSKSDGALYWTAYAQNRLGQRTESLATLDDLLKKFPSSRWASEAKALRVEVRQLVGQPIRPEQEADEDLKLIAINSLLRSDPDRTVPMLEQLLAGHDSPRVKERALFVLAQSSAPRAKEILVTTAKGGSNPDLQLKAIRYLGMSRNQESRQLLSDLYKSTNDVDVKSQILQSFMLAGERNRVFVVARDERTVSLRKDAVQQLGVMSAEAELSELYQLESSVDLKKQILQALFIGGSADKLTEIARSEKNPELRSAAVRNLGMTRNKKTADALLSIYTADKDESVRKAAIQALFLQQNATALVAIARQETDAGLRKDIVEKLSMMKSKEATDYLLELLKK